MKNKKQKFIVVVIFIVMIVILMFLASSKLFSFEGNFSQNGMTVPATLTITCKRYEQWMISNTKEVSLEVNIDSADESKITDVSYEIMSGRFHNVENNFLYGSGSIYDKQRNEFIFSNIYFDLDYKQCVFVCEKDDILFASGEDEFVAEINRFQGK